MHQDIVVILNITQTTKIRNESSSRVRNAHNETNDVDTPLTYLVLLVASPINGCANSRSTATNWCSQRSGLSSNVLSHHLPFDIAILLIYVDTINRNLMSRFQLRSIFNIELEQFSFTENL